MTDAPPLETKNKQEPIRLRLDVDYAYPSRKKSFVCTALGIKHHGKHYLKNSKIIAKMINESKRDIKAVWFFTPFTIPDKELLDLLTPDKHEVGLHVATNPYREMENLEKATGRKLNYYTVHGTERLLGRIVWHRKLSQAKVPMPEDFPLKSYYVYHHLGLDVIAHTYSVEEAVKQTEESIAKGDVILIHPEWLLQRGKHNPRGPYYEPLKRLLGVDSDLDYFVVRKKGFFNLAEIVDVFAYLKRVNPTEQFISKVKDRDADIFTFIERTWCDSPLKPSKSWFKEEDNIALLNISTYDEWFERVGKKTRNMVRKAEKSGIETRIIEPDEKFAEGVWKIFNETPIRQGRASPYYGIPLEKIKHDLLNAKGLTFVGAYLQDELAGFIQLAHGDQLSIITQILALQKYQDKAVNNATVAKAVQYCAENHISNLMYGRMENHPSLDKFKESNGFVKCNLNRYYIPLTTKGKVAIKLHLHRPLKDALPLSIRNRLLGLYSWVSRTKIKLRNG
ncbi:MAG: hypothetical protein ACQCN5_14155 [Candidatus Bathyarchaeia archaeon]